MIVSRDDGMATLQGASTQASRTPGSTIPEELQRQADRIQEQFFQLQTILTNAAGHLSEMSRMMEPYDVTLSGKMSELDQIISDYVPKARDIYDEVSNSLSTYASNLLTSLDDLTSGIDNLRTSVENLG